MKTSIATVFICVLALFVSGCANLRNFKPKKSAADVLRIAESGMKAIRFSMDVRCAKAFPDGSPQLTACYADAAERFSLAEDCLSTAKIWLPRLERAIKNKDAAAEQKAIEALSSAISVLPAPYDNLAESLSDLPFTR